MFLPFFGISFSVDFWILFRFSNLRGLITEMLCAQVDIVLCISYRHSGKTFFINKLYGGCPADEGWLMIEEDDSHPCSYDKQPSYPAFVYAPGPTSTIWETSKNRH